MQIPSYFGPQLMGGIHNSAGLSYQDTCALYNFFNYLNKDDELLSLGIEMINDFSLHKEGHIITAQVKIQTLSLKDMLKILEKTPLKRNDTIMVVCAQFDDELRQIIKKRDRFRYAIQSDLDSDWKESITSDFEAELKKKGIDFKNNLFLKSEYVELPADMAHMALFFVITKWLERERRTVDISGFMNKLSVFIQKLRETSGSLSLKQLKEFVEEHSTESLVKQIIKTAYETQFIQPTELISVLGETKDDIFKQLEKRIQEAQDHFNNQEFSESLEIYSSIEKIYQKNELKVQCAVLHELLNNYDYAIKYCDEILKMDPSHYEACLIRGSSLGALNRFNEAIEQFEYTLSLKPSVLAHYNLGYIYFISESADSTKKAIAHFKACLEIDSMFEDAHLNLSIAYFQTGVYGESLKHINKALDIDSESYEAVSHKGELYRFFGLYDDAIDYFEQCLTKHNENQQALYGLALCFTEKGYLSEAAIYYKRLFEFHSDKIFKKGVSNTIGGKTLIVDLGWKRTIYGHFEVIKENLIYIDIAGVQLKIPLSIAKDYIFIGCLQLIDETGTIIYPTVGKFMETKEDFQTLKNNIQESVQLDQFFDKPLFVDFNGSIEINIEEREKYVLIEMFVCNQPLVVGITDQKGDGFESFKDYFKLYGQCRIHFECVETSEVVVIDCISKVNLKSLV
ncbi:tetratricopeptide repeat protein [Paenibacillus sp. LPE1-1-1.1]|uniref:tetratricopeptide repeat protein n=1 Tax=Paenibacillus sp. LPE1-1-1.1 TaxID=3135230 RepID=UPI003442E4D2